MKEARVCGNDTLHMFECMWKGKCSHY